MTPASKPSVGLFWGLPDPNGGVWLLFTTSELAQAETYGECLTDGRGHQEVWDRWREMSPRELKAFGIPLEVKTQAYDHWPRGRVVYEIRQSRFIIYADQRLHGRRTIKQINSVFGLKTSSVLVRADDHYHTGQHNGR
jgi:hypothetical protein